MAVLGIDLVGMLGTIWGNDLPRPNCTCNEFISACTPADVWRTPVPDHHPSVIARLGVPQSWTQEAGSLSGYCY